MKWHKYHICALYCSYTDRINRNDNRIPPTTQNGNSSANLEILNMVQSCGISCTVICSAGVPLIIDQMNASSFYYIFHPMSASSIQKHCWISVISHSAPADYCFDAVDKKYCYLGWMWLLIPLQHAQSTSIWRFLIGKKEVANLSF